jgi:hypothetical protein
MMLRLRGTMPRLRPRAKTRRSESGIYRRPSQDPLRKQSNRHAERCPLRRSDATPDCGAGARFIRLTDDGFIASIPVVRISRCEANHFLQALICPPFSRTCPSLTNPGVSPRGLPEFFIRYSQASRGLACFAICRSYAINDHAVFVAGLCQESFAADPLR